MLNAGGFRTLFELAPDSMLILYPNGFIKAINHIAHGRLGYTRAEMLGRHIGNFISPEYAAMLDKRFANVQTNGYLTYESVQLRKDGAPLPVEISSRLVELDGKPMIFSIVRDIADRKKSQYRLEASLEFSNSLVGTMHDGFVVLDKNGRVVEVNLAICRMTGFLREELIGANVPFPFWPPEEYRNLQAELQNTLEGEGSSSELTFMRKSGERFPAIVSSAQVRDRKGSIISYTASIKDMTEHKAIEAKLRQSEEMLRSIFDGTLDGICLVNAKTMRYVTGNPAFSRMIGYSPDELVQLGVRDFHPEEAWPYVTDQFDKSLRGEVQLATDLPIKRKDGSVLYVDIKPTRVTFGGTDYLLGTFRDITERKASEAKIRRLIDLYAALNRCNQTILRCNSEEELFREVCVDAVRFGGFQMAWIGLADRASGMVRPMACYGMGTEYLNGIQISLAADEPTGRGPVGSSIRESRPFWSQNFQQDITMAPWHARGARYGWGSIASLPLHRNGVAIGAIVLYAPVPEAFDEAARNLLEGMATDISHALTRLALLAERKHAEEEMRIAAVTFETQEAIVITDPDGSILRVNQAFQDITGYSALEVVGKNPRIFQSGQHGPEFYQAMWSALLETGRWSGEVWDRRKDGSVYPKLMTITAVYSNSSELTHYVAVFRDISNRKQSEQEIHQLAFYDSLTALPNRRLLMDRLQQAITVSARNLCYGAVLFLDLDDFKTINDTQGHGVGDQLLVEIGRRLQTCVRHSDSVARLSGDEFVVVLADLGTNASEAATRTGLVAEKIRGELSQSYHLNEYEFLPTVSIGITLFCGDLESAQDLLMHADVAMYQAKAAARNTIRFFDPKMQKAVEARAAMEADLRHAVEKKQLCLYYQIQVDRQRRPIGAEVLLRWNHPRYGLILPTQFIPLAEETGLIVPIGAWVLHESCLQLKEWQNNPQTKDLTLAVNVSARQFRQADFVAQVQRILMNAGANPFQLKLELTESIMLENIEDTISKMRELKMCGIGFSMDDFGTGYSSLQYLKQLPLDLIKIDRSFVCDIATNLNDASIVQTIIAMTAALRLNVIAEGVETESQQEFLELSGCNAFQGYLFGKPIPLDEFESLLDTYEHCLVTTES